MPRFVSHSSVEPKISAPWWEPWEYVRVGEYSISDRDKMNAAIVEIVGPYGEVPEARIKEATVPVLVAGLRAWTFRDLDNEDLQELYEAKAEELDKDVATLTDEDKRAAVRDIPIVELGEGWIRSLKVDDALFIASAIRRKNQIRTEAEEQEFLRSAGNRDTDEEQAAGRDDEGNGDPGHRLERG